jgi:hypothetical protein
VHHVGFIILEFRILVSSVYTLKIVGNLRYRCNYKTNAPNFTSSEYSHFCFNNVVYGKITFVLNVLLSPSVSEVATIKGRDFLEHDKINCY